MAQEIEIEFKNLLTKDEYEIMYSYFRSSPHQIMTQVNHYFDTQDHSLKHAGCALRVRIKDECYFLTLKEPQAIGLLETTDELSKREYEELLHTHQVNSPHVLHQLNQLNITSPILPIASLETKRLETTFMDQLIALDASTYYGMTDYEIELETQDPPIGEQVFKDLLTNFQVPRRPAMNKIKRAFLYKQRLMNSTEN
jgi:uncharacterized protein YjbK